MAVSRIIHELAGEAISPTMGADRQDAYPAFRAPE
jgi:hypothetical protein